MWVVRIHKNVARALHKYPRSVKDRFDALVKDIVEMGPVRGNWPNYSKLGDRRHHCHLKKGKPAYVAVWVESDMGIQLVEVRYVGTHENAPY